jgi:hypothetical protein
MISDILFCWMNENISQATHSCCTAQCLQQHRGFINEIVLMTTP